MRDIILRCDRCNVDVGTKFEQIIQVAPTSSGLYMNGKNYSEIELCYSCAKALSEFLTISLRREVTEK